MVQLRSWGASSRSDHRRTGRTPAPTPAGQRKSLSPAEIVGSTVVVIFVTSLAAALVRLNGPFLAALSEQRSTLLGAMLFAGPGVILGGQLGPMVARRLNVRTLRWYVAVILLLVGTPDAGAFRRAGRVHPLRGPHQPNL